jgi:hypothetical protein
MLYFEMSTTPSSLLLVAALNPSVVGGWALVALRQIAVRAGRNGVIRDQRGQSCLPVHARPAPKADLVLVYFRQALSRNQTPAAALRHPPTSGDHGGVNPTDKHRDWLRNQDCPTSGRRSEKAVSDLGRPRHLTKLRSPPRLRMSRASLTCGDGRCATACS